MCAGTRQLSEKFPSVQADFRVCCFFAENHAEITKAFKGRFTEASCITGKELCAWIGKPHAFEEINAEWGSAADENLDFCAEAIASDPDLVRRVVEVASQRRSVV